MWSRFSSSHFVKYIPTHFTCNLTCFAFAICRVLAKILIPAGTKDVPVGKALCVIVSLLRPYFLLFIYREISQEI